MSDMIFCYCCRVHHPQALMRRFRTRNGVRWRCQASIEAAARDVAERDATGRLQSAMNREAARRLAHLAALVRSEDCVR
jgi:hypothetical protein